MTAQHLLVTGGIYHEFDTSSAALARIVEPLGLRTTVSDDPESAFKCLDGPTPPALLTINALRFTMVQDHKYAPLRARWAFSLSAESRARLARYVEGGGALLGLHTASICFDDWTEWSRILGVTWKWGRSFHPPAGPIRVEPMEARTDAADSPAAIVADTSAFEVNDELYHDLYVEPGALPLLRARILPEDESRPVMWSHRYGAGRVIYDSLGHSADSLNEPTHERILRRACAWMVTGHA